MTTAVDSVPLSDVLARIEAWYAANVPAIHASLRPGASEAELNALEAKTGLKLPDAYRTLYHWHNGQEFGAGSLFGLNFQSLAEVEVDWAGWQDILRDMPEMNEDSPSASHPDGAIQDAYVTRGWLSFLNDGGGGSVGIDLNPGAAGKTGQVINFGRNEEEKYVLADSLDSFLREYLRRLETGRVTVAKLEDVEKEVWSVRLHDDHGLPDDGYFFLAQLFPGFGASPGVWQR